MRSRKLEKKAPPWSVGPSVSTGEGPASASALFTDSALTKHRRGSGTGSPPSTASIHRTRMLVHFPPHPLPLTPTTGPLQTLEPWRTQ